MQSTINKAAELHKNTKHGMSNKNTKQFPVLCIFKLLSALGSHHKIFQFPFTKRPTGVRHYHTP